MDLGFTPNNRPKIKEQIQGIHAAIATLAKQPVFLLNDQEGSALTNALCDVCDYHHINLTSAGGVYSLYLVLVITAFSIYKPRIDFIIASENATNITPTAPANPADATNRQRRNGGIDFSADIAATVNEGVDQSAEQPPAGTMRYN